MPPPCLPQAPGSISHRMEPTPPRSGLFLCSPPPLELIPEPSLGSPGHVQDSPLSHFPQSEPGPDWLLDPSQGRAVGPFLALEYELRHLSARKCKRHICRFQPPPCDTLPSPLPFMALKIWLTRTSHSQTSLCVLTLGRNASGCFFPMRLSLSLT